LQKGSAELLLEVGNIYQNLKERQQELETPLNAAIRITAAGWRLLAYQD